MTLSFSRVNQSAVQEGSRVQDVVDNEYGSVKATTCDDLPLASAESFSSDDGGRSSLSTCSSDSSCCEAEESSDSKNPEDVDASIIMALNDAYVALETMRKQNLEVTFCSKTNVTNRNIHEHCTACLYQELAQPSLVRSNSSTSRWSFAARRRPTKIPSCLVCANPVCRQHSCKEQHSVGLVTCLDCVWLLDTETIIQKLQSTTAAATATSRQVLIDQMVNAYDRALILLQAASPQVHQIIVELESSSKSTTQLQVSSSSVGILSGVTGVGAIAGPAAAAIHFTYAASLLTPVGPPLLLASLLLGGTAASASIGTEVYQKTRHHSHRGQQVSQLVTWYQVVHNIRTVLMGCGSSSSCIARHEEASEEKELAAMENDDKDSDVILLDSRQVMDTLVARVPDDDSTATNNNDMDATDSETNLTESSPTNTAVVVPNSSNNNKRHSLACLMPLTPLVDDVFLTVSKVFMVPSSGGARLAVSRASSHALKVAQIATLACGALSAATIVMEASNLSKSLEHWKKGSPCEKAQLLRQIQSELVILPTTDMIARQCCDLYLLSSSSGAEQQTRLV
jgi:hypothetical protein